MLYNKLLSYKLTDLQEGLYDLRSFNAEYAGNRILGVVDHFGEIHATVWYKFNSMCTLVCRI